MFTIDLTPTVEEQATIASALAQAVKECFKKNCTRKANENFSSYLEGCERNVFERYKVTKFCRSSQEVRADNLMEGLECVVPIISQFGFKWDGMWFKKEE